MIKRSIWIGLKDELLIHNKEYILLILFVHIILHSLKQTLHKKNESIIND